MEANTSAFFAMRTAMEHCSLGMHNLTRGMSYTVFYGRILSVKNKRGEGRGGEGLGGERRAEERREGRGEEGRGEQMR